MKARNRPAALGGGDDLGHEVVVRLSDVPFCHTSRTRCGLSYGAMLGFPQAVEDGLHAAGYEIQPRKGWRVSPISDRPCVTGLVLTRAGRVNIPWALRWRMWGLRCKAWWSADEAVLARLGGYKGYARMVK